MFEGVGKIGSYLNLKQLKVAKDYKVKTGQTLKFDKKSDMQTIVTQKTTKKSGDAIKSAAIKNKLKHGEKLTKEEMNYLKENDESTYRKAKKVEQAREELEQDLRRAKTKDEARRAVMRATLKAAGEASAELSAAKAGMGGGAVPAGGGYQAGQEVTGLDMSATAGDVGAVGAEVAADVGEGAESVGTNVDITSESTGEFTSAGEKIISDYISSINESINSDGENAVNGNTSENGNAQDDDEHEPIASAQGNQEDKALEILEELMYKMKAIQKAWEEFAHSKEYKEMPEDILSDDKKKSKGYTKQESQMLDMVLTYKTSEMERQAERFIDMQS